MSNAWQTLTRQGTSLRTQPEEFVLPSAFKLIMNLQAYFPTGFFAIANV